MPNYTTYIDSISDIQFMFFCVCFDYFVDVLYYFMCTHEVNGNGVNSTTIRIPSVVTLCINYICSA